MESMADVLVIIPALNEAETIGTVIDQLHSLGLTRIRVVDNGSTDSTPRVARKTGAQVLIERRRGYGAACWQGLQDLPEEVAWILFCDADGCDVLEDPPRLLAEREDADFILGNRQGTIEGRHALTLPQRFGNALCGWLLGLAWGQQFADLGPMRLIRRRTLEALAMKDRGFGWTVEMQAKAVASGVRIIEVPVGYRARRLGKSKISGTVRGTVLAGSTILSTLAKVWWREGLGRKIAAPRGQTVLWWASMLLLLAGAFGMAPFGDLSVAGAIPPFLTGACVMASGFFLLLMVRDLRAGQFWVTALAPRAVLLFAMYPGNDIWRYMWEGMIQLHGFNPYALPPTASELAAFRPEWWEQINNPTLTAIYPPLAQLGFRLLAWIGPSVILFKFAFTVADLVVAWLLARRFGYRPALIYAANPLIIYHLSGGGHLDSWFLLAMVAGWLAAEAGNWRRAALWLGAGVALKYVCLPAVAFLVWSRRKELRGREQWILLALATAPMLAALALVPDVLSTRALAPSDFTLYARSSEFVPYWVAQVWPWSQQHNEIYLLPLAAGLLWLFLRCYSMTEFFENYLGLLLVLSPAVHGWYFTWLVPFAVATRHAGTLALSVSGFAYFWLIHRGATMGDWTQPTATKLVLWMPFLLGWIWHASRLRREIDNTPRDPASGRLSPTGSKPAAQPSPCTTTLGCAEKTE